MISITSESTILKLIKAEGVMQIILYKINYTKFIFGQYKSNDIFYNNKIMFLKMMITIYYHLV